ncbi:hypothetical protein KAR91_14710 [Candidatus Pacearchaeota archaeon]|nr:hypothetical protein [Candidatus Pacearchaeota archaeon]
MFKPWLSKNVKDTRRSTERDYPPKRKKPWLAGSFQEMEHFHEETYRPMDYPVVSPKKDKCAGRVLRPAQGVTWESGEGGIPKDGDVKEFQASVSGAVGNVTYYMDPFWSEVNEAGDIATIDPNTGLITLEENVCQGSYPPWIIYWVCDDCGCSSGTIWLEDSSDDCCGGCNCDSSDPCVSDCCITEDGAPEEITAGGTKQYYCGGGGEWSVTGTGLSIDQNGLLSADSGTACGTGTVSNTICQDVEVRVQGNGSYWAFTSWLCGEGLGGPAFCNVDSGGSRIQYLGACRSDAFGCPNDEVDTYRCGSAPCACAEGQYFCSIAIKEFEWSCPP